MKKILIISFVYAILGVTCKLDELGQIDPCVINPPVASFSLSSTNCSAPCTITFTNNSLNNPTKYNWSFGDGNSSTAQTPQPYLYNVPGNYTIKLTVSTDNGCSHTIEQSIAITDNNPLPVAEFSFDVANNMGNAPCEVKFQNTSENASSYEWDFGDGSPKVQSNSPTHTYQLPNVYTVKLTATGPAGTSNKTKNVTINTLKFIKDFGDAAQQESGACVRQTADRGYVIVGSKENGANGKSDLWLAKIDPKGQQLDWENTFGGPGFDRGASLTITSENDIVAVGSKEGTNSWADGYMIKTFSVGNLLYQRTFGGNESDGFWDIETSDKGYIAVGHQGSRGLVSQASPDFIFLGDIFYGFNEDLLSISKTNDGGYIISGYTTENGHDFRLYKSNSSGGIEWTYDYGGAGVQFGVKAIQTSDGQYLFVGETEGAQGNDISLMIISADGKMVVNTTPYRYGNYHTAKDIISTNDGNYVILGSTDDQITLIKIKPDGTELWHESYGISNYLQDAGSVQQTSDGGFIIIGTINYSGNKQVLLVKTDAEGKAQ